MMYWADIDAAYNIYEFKNELTQEREVDPLHQSSNLQIIPCRR